MEEVLIEVGILDEVERKLNIMENLIPLITDLGWEYDRMSACLLYTSDAADE